MKLSCLTLRGQIRFLVGSRFRHCSRLGSDLIAARATGRTRPSFIRAICFRANFLLVVFLTLVSAAFVSSVSAQVTLSGNEVLETSGSLGGSMFSASITSSLYSSPTLRATGNISASGYIQLINSYLYIDTNGYDIAFGQSPGAKSVEGTGSVYKSGAGTLTLAGALGANFTSTGGEIVTQSVGRSNEGGYITLTGSTLTTSAISNGVVTLNAGATLKAGAAFTSFKSISVLTPTELILTGSDATFDTNGHNVNYDHLISGSGNLNKAGAGTLSLGYNGNGFSGDVVVNAGTLKIAASGALSPGKIVTVNSGANLDLNSNAASVAGLAGAGAVALGSATLTVDQAADSTFSGVISGTGALTKSGAGSLTLSGTNTYSGATALNAGTLVVDGSIANSSVTVTGGLLNGSGTTGALIVGSGGTFSPGNSPGALNAGDTIWAGGGAYLWEINDAHGAAGENPGWDLLNVSGTLTITATNVNPFNFELRSLTAGDIAGDAINFDFSEDLSYTVATASDGIIGFSADKFFIDTTGFTNAYNGNWSLALSGNSLNLIYTAVPEPSTYATLAGLIALGLVVWRKRGPKLA